MKSPLRARMRAVLASFSFFELIEKSNRLSERFFDQFVVPHAALLRNQAVVSYHPFATEAQINIENEAQNEPYQVAYVKIQNWEQSLMTAAFARRDQPGHWEEKQFTDKIKIFQPAPHQPECRSDAISVILVPGLAFTAQGARLGRGAGFYDRFLQAHPEALRVGIGFQEQILSELPLHSWDQRLDVVLTDQHFFQMEPFSQWQKQGRVKERAL